MSEVTRILSEIERGDSRAAEQLLPLVYSELRRLAAIKLVQEKPGQTLQATALVHEAYLRLIDGEKVQNWDSRGHFFAAAAEAMRRILIDHARKKARLKRGGNVQHLDIDSAQLVCAADPDELLWIDEALSKLATADQTAAEIVKLRFFAGLSIEETAKALGTSATNVYRQWTFARAWLRNELTEVIT